jgi:hypothetical protein
MYFNPGSWSFFAAMNHAKKILRPQAISLVAVMAFCLVLPGVLHAGIVIGGKNYTVGGLSESINAPFTQASTQSANNDYGGLVQIKVSGTGQSFLTNINDAFYVLGGVNNPDANYYELTMDNVPINGGAPSIVQDAKYFIVYDIDGGNEVTSRPYKPAYREDHTYTFVVDLGLIGVSTTSSLYFGVSDGQYNDNTGSFTIQISRLTETPSAVPEPTSMAIFGIGALGFAYHNRRKFIG